MKRKNFNGFITKNPIPGLKEKLFYRNGKLHGVQKSYYSGRLGYEEIYSNGELIGRRHYSSSSHQLTAEIFYHMNCVQVRKYHDDGRLRQIEIYGSRDGAYYRYESKI